MTNSVFVPGSQNGYLMPEIVPEARGKAEALRTFLARGGQRKTRGKGRFGGARYVSGPFKGKTMDEVQVEFEKRWAGADGSIKDKYAAMAGVGALSPSERADYEKRVAERKGIVGSVAAPVVEKPTMKQGSAGRMEKTRPGPGVNNPNAPTDEKLSKRVGATARESVVQQDVPVIPGVSKGMDQSSVTAFNQKMAAGGLSSVGDVRAEAEKQRRGIISKVEAQMDAEASTKPPLNEFAQTANLPLPKSPPTGDPRNLASAVGFAAKPPAATKSSDSSPGSWLGFKRGQAAAPQVAAFKKPDSAGMSADGMNWKKPTPIASPRAQNIADSGGDVSKLSTDDRMIVQGKTNSGATAVQKAPNGKPDPIRNDFNDITAKPVAPVMAETGPVNKATGLPFGYRPGDKVSPELQTAADKSVAAQSSTKPPPRATPVHISAFTGKAVDPNMSLEERQANYAKEEAKRVNGQDWKIAQDIDRANPNNPHKIATREAGMGIARDGSQLTIDSPEMALIKRARMQGDPAAQRADALEKRRMAFNKRNPGMALDADPRKNKPLLPSTRA